MNEETRSCQNCKTEFVIDREDREFYERLKVPFPTFCWLCRAQRRMAFRNERTLYKRKSDVSGKEIFSAFAPDAPVKVYEKEIWLADDWDPMQYGRDFDPSRPFLEQFKELLHVVPLKNLNVVNGVNSDYCNNFTDPKNCYLTFNGKGAEDCMYGNGFSSVRDSVDNSHIGNCESCYEGFWLTDCTNALFCSQCESSYNIWFSKNCTGCHDCFGCVNLRNKSYHIFNKPYAKEEYEKKTEELQLNSYEGLQKIKNEVRQFWNRFPNKYITGTHNTDVSGDYIENSKDTKQSFLVREGEHLRYCQYVQEQPPSRYCYDYTAWGSANEFIYECAACGIGTNNIKFCYNVQENVHDIDYSYMCSGSSYLFGCVGVRRKQYCILNTQYSKEEYEKLRVQIMEQMNAMPYRDARGREYRYGEFFPIEISPFAYNETLAQEYFPLTKEEAIAQGYTWRDGAERKYVPTLQADKLADRIGEVQDSVVNEVIGCSHGGRCNDQCKVAFRIIPRELEFYRQKGLPLPRLCPSCRHAERIRQRSLLPLYERACQCGGERSEGGKYRNVTPHFHGTAHCSNTFETSYAPTRSVLVYCEVCYQSEMV